MTVKRWCLILTVGTGCVCLVAVMGVEGMEGICHVGFWSFKRAFLISFGLTWVMFIVTVEMSSQLPHSSQQFTDTMLCYAILCYAVLCYAMMYYTILNYTILYR